MLILRSLYHKFNQIFKYYLTKDFIILKEDKDSLLRLACAINTSFRHKRSKKKPSILVEGHFSNSGINYLFRTILLSKTLQAELGGELAVVFNGTKNSFWRKPIFLYKKVGFSKFIFCDWEYKAHKTHIIHRLSLHLWNQINHPADIINLYIDDVFIGDLLYDDILKKENLSTIENLDLKFKIYFDNISRFYFDYDELFKKNQFKLYISTHTAYSDYGLICRIALKYNVKVFETTDIHTAFFINSKIIPTYNEGFKNIISKKMTFYDNNEDLKTSLLLKYNNHLEKRMLNKINQIDVKYAYENKVIFDREKLASKYSVDQKKKNIFIVAHVFKDSPHVSSHLLFNDYYDWFFQTVKYCNENSDKYNCFVKAHPSSQLYGETGLINNILNKNKFDNIYMLSEDFSPKSFVNCADAIITCQGTVGIEFSCLGIPIITAGGAFYCNYGFTIDSTTQYDYFINLSNLDKIKKLNKDQIINANYVYCLYNELITSENPLISTEVLEFVWGLGREIDIDKAFRLFLNNLDSFDVKSHPLYEKTKEILKLHSIDFYD